jgi:DNA-binding transcriptional LysR family regulator
MSSTSLIHRLTRHLKMSELRAFTAVLEHRSFHKAAARLHLTQPTLSKSIAGLEEKLGVKLFDRTACGVEPTVHGHSFAPRALAVFEELRRAALNLAQLSSGTVGTLRVGVLPMPTFPFVSVAVNRLIEQHPSIAVSMVEGHATELLERLRKRDIELAILRPDLVDPEDDLSVGRLFYERACVVAATTHPLAARSQLQWAELLQQRWVLPPADCFSYQQVRRSLDSIHLRMPKPAVETMSIQLRLSLVLHAGMLSFGMCSQTRFASGKELVVRLPFELPVTSTVLATMSLKTYEQSPLARQFIGHIQTLANALPTLAAPVQEEPALVEVAS